MRTLATVVFATALAVLGLIAPGPRVVSAEAATTLSSLKVVLIVGPVAGSTSYYRSDADAAAAEARRYTNNVITIYSPTATWAKVKPALQGASIVVYMGHGNGSPGPYGPFNPLTEDGLGLNPSAGTDNSTTKYYGESYIASGIHLAPNAVVFLGHLCYSAGNSESWQPNPTKSVAKQRIDNYGAGFLRTNARVVFAEARNTAGYILYSLFRTNRTMRQIFWSSPKATHSYAFSFTSSRTSGMTAISDPYAPSRYYRSVIGKLSMTAATWR